MTSELDIFLEHPVLRAMKRGRRVERIGSAARTDTVGVADGEVHYYRSGTSIFKQMFDAVNVAWVSVELT